MSGDSIFKPAFVLMTGRALGFAAAFAIPVVLARLFSQSDYGTYKQLFLVYGTLYSIGQLGMAESLFYFLPAARDHAGRYVLNAVLVLAVSGAAFTAALWGAQGLIARWFNNPALIGCLPLIGIYLMLMLQAAVLEITIISRKRHFQAFVSYALSDLGKAVLLILPVLWSGQLRWLLYGAIAMAALRLAATLIYLRRQFGSGLALDRGLARAQFLYAGPFSLYVLIEVAQASVHLYAVSFYFDAATYAVYAVGCLSIPLVEFLTGSAGNVMMVRMRERLLEGAGAAVLAIWRDTTRKLILIFAPLVGCLLVAAHPLIVGLFTKRYEASVPVFMAWELIILFSGLLTDSVLRVYSKIPFLMGLGLVKLVLVAAGISWFMSAFGLVGAALIVVIVTAVTKTLALAKIKSVMQCRLAEFLPWRGLLSIGVAAAAAALPALAVKSELSLPPLVALIVIATVYAVCYLAIAWHFGLLSRDEKRALTGWRPWPAKAG
jgi:O-antigen/teichoic acid export membrane protein